METATPPGQTLPPQKPAQLYESKPLPPLPPIPSRSRTTSKSKSSSSNRQMQKLPNPPLPGSRPMMTTKGYSQRRSQSQRTSTSKPRPPPIYLPPHPSYRYRRCIQDDKAAVGPSHPLSPPPDSSSPATPPDTKRYSMLITPDDLNPPPLLSGAVGGMTGTCTAPTSPTSSTYSSEGVETTVSEPVPYTPGPDVYGNYSLDDIDYDADETLICGSFGFPSTTSGLDSPVPAIILPLNLRRASNRVSGVSGYSSSVYSDASPPQPHQSHQPSIDRGDADMAGKQPQETAQQEMYPSNSDMEEYVIKDMYHASVGQIAASTRESPTIQRTTTSLSQRTMWPTMEKVKRRFSTKWIPGAPSLRRRPVSVQSNVTNVDHQSLKSTNATTTVSMLKSTFEEDEDEGENEGKNRFGYILRVFGRARARESVVFENEPAWSERKTTTAEEKSTWPEVGATARRPKRTNRQSKFAMGMQSLGTQARLL